MLLGDCMEMEEENRLPALPEGAVAPVLAVPVELLRPAAAPPSQVAMLELAGDLAAGSVVPAGVIPEDVPLEEPVETSDIAETPAIEDAACEDVGCEDAACPSLEEAPHTAVPGVPVPAPATEALEAPDPVPAAPVATVQEAPVLPAAVAAVGQSLPQAERVPTPVLTPKAAPAAAEDIVEPAAESGIQATEEPVPQETPVIDTLQAPQPEKQQAPAPAAPAPKRSEPAREAAAVEMPPAHPEALDVAVAEAPTRLPEAPPEIRTAAPARREREEPAPAALEVLQQPTPEGVVPAPVAVPVPPAEVSKAAPAPPDHPVIRHPAVAAPIPAGSSAPAEAAIGARLEDSRQAPVAASTSEAKGVKVEMPPPTQHAEVPPAEPEAGRREAPVKSAVMAADAVPAEAYGQPAPANTGSSPEAAAPPRAAMPDEAVAPEPRGPAAPSREPVREIAVRLAGQDENVEIRMAERAGEIRLSVHAADAELRRALQDNLPELVQGLEERGFATQAWRTGESSLRSDTGEHGGGEPPQGGGQNGGHQDGRQHRRNPQPAWLDEIARSLESDREGSVDDEYR